MPRPPRIQFVGANYHVVPRGDGRRRLFHDTGHYERFTRGLEDELQRSGWLVLAYCWMPNHIHALLQTPDRNRRAGHLYQGRYKAFVVDGAGYYWMLSRYIQLNRCKGSKPLAHDPEE